MSDLNDMLDIDDDIIQQTKIDKVNKLSTIKKSKIPSFQLDNNNNKKQKLLKIQSLKRELKTLTPHDSSNAVDDELDNIEIETQNSVLLRKVHWSNDIICSSARNTKTDENGKLNNDIELFHWTKFHHITDYRYAKFNKQVKILYYTEDEYKFIENEFWSREETDKLFELCELYTLRFLIIEDRYNNIDVLSKANYNLVLNKAKRLLRSNKTSAITSDKLKPIPFVIRFPNSVPSLNAVKNRFNNSNNNMCIEEVNDRDVKVNIDDDTKLNIEDNVEVSCENKVANLNITNEVNMDIENILSETIVGSSETSESTELNLDNEKGLAIKIENSDSLDINKSKSDIIIGIVETENSNSVTNIETHAIENIKIEVDTSKFEGESSSLHLSFPPVNIPVIVEQVVIPEPSKFPIETATKYYKEILLCQFYSNILKKALQALEQEITSINTNLNLASSQFNQLPVLHNFQLQTLITQHQTTLASVTEQVIQQEALLKDKLNARIDVDKLDSDVDTDLKLDDLITSTVPLNAKQVESCMLAFLTQRKAQVDNYTAQQQAQQQELITSQQLHRQKFEFLIQSYQTLISSLSVELQKMQLISREGFDYNLYLNTLIMMHSELKTVTIEFPNVDANTVVPEDTDASTKVLLLAQAASNKFNEVIISAKDPIASVKEYLAAIIQVKKLQKKKRKLKDGNGEIKEKKSKPNKPKKDSSLEMVPLTFGSQKLASTPTINKLVSKKSSKIKTEKKSVEEIKKKKKPKSKKVEKLKTPEIIKPAFKLNYISFFDDSLLQNPVRLCAIIIPEITDEEFEAMELKESRVENQKSVPVFEDDYDSDGKKKRKRPHSETASKQQKIRMDARHEAKRKEREVETENFLSEWMLQIESSTDNRLNEAEIEKHARNLIEKNIWPKFFVSSEELKERFYSIQRILLVLRTEPSEYANLLSTHPWFDPEEQFYSIGAEIERKVLLERFDRRTNEDELSIKKVVDESKVIDTYLLKAKKATPKAVSHKLQNFHVQECPETPFPAPCKSLTTETYSTPIATNNPGRKKSVNPISSPISNELAASFLTSSEELLDKRAARLAKKSEKFASGEPVVDMYDMSDNNLYATRQSLAAMGMQWCNQPSKPVNFTNCAFLQSQRKTWPLNGIMGNIAKQVETELENHSKAPINSNAITFHSNKIYEKYDQLKQDAFLLLQLKKATQKVEQQNLQLVKQIEGFMFKFQRKK